MLNNKIADLLDGLDLFREFPYPELQILSRYVVMQDVDKGKVIFHEGDPGNYMLILIEGRIGIFKGGENGQHLLSYEGEGRIVGEMALLDHERRSATCIADTACELLTLTSENLKKLAAENPPTAYRFMYSLAQLLSRRLRRTSGMMADFLN